jgi:hypothetical protein
LLDCLTIAKADKLMAVEPRVYSSDDRFGDVNDKIMSVVLKKRVKI